MACGVPVVCSRGRQLARKWWVMRPGLFSPMIRHAPGRKQCYVALRDEQLRAALRHAGLQRTRLFPGRETARQTGKNL